MAARKTTAKKSTKSHTRSSKRTTASKPSRRRSAAKSSGAAKKKHGPRSKAAKETVTKATKKATSLKSTGSASSNVKLKSAATVQKGTGTKADKKSNLALADAKPRSEVALAPNTAGLSKLHANEMEVKLTVKDMSRDQRPAGRGAAAAAAKAPTGGPQPVAADLDAARESEAQRASKTGGRDLGVVPAKSAKPLGQRQGFKLNEYVVYPAHGVGQIVAIEDQEVAGFRLELFVINFSKDKMTLRVPTSKVTGVGLRKISDPDTAKRSLEILTGRARIKRTMWSRRAQEYETKINSGDIRAIAEVVRDLYRSEAQPEQSYSERQLYEAALDRMVREIAAVQKSTEMDALKAVEAQLQKGHTRSKATAEPAETSGGEIEEAA